MCYCGNSCSSPGNERRNILSGMKSAHKRRLLEQSKPKQKTENGLFSHCVHWFCKEKKKEAIKKCKKSQTVQSCLFSNYFNRNQGKLKLMMGEGWSPGRNGQVQMLKILLEETEFRLKSEISRCSPYTLWFCQVVGLEITSRKEKCEGMEVSHQHQNDE